MYWRLTVRMRLGPRGRPHPCEARILESVAARSPPRTRPGEQARADLLIEQIVEPEGPHRRCRRISLRFVGIFPERIVRCREVLCEG